jgi:hypothetical protein
MVNKIEIEPNSFGYWQFVFLLGLLVVGFALFWYWFARDMGPYYPAYPDVVKFSSNDFDTKYADATNTFTVPDKWINGGVIYPIHDLANAAATSQQSVRSGSYVVFIVPPASGRKVGDTLLFAAKSTVLDTTDNSVVTQYYGFYENDPSSTLNDMYLAMELENKNAVATSKHATIITAESYSLSRARNVVELQVFDFGDGKVWVPFGGYSDAYTP